jgi:hypothetical protein
MESLPPLPLSLLLFVHSLPPFPPHFSALTIPLSLLFVHSLPSFPSYFSALAALLLFLREEGGATEAVGGKREKRGVRRGE